MTEDRQQKAIQHATLAQLVAMRDGEHLSTDVYVSVVAHVDGCEFCQARLEEVYSVGHQLQQGLLFEAELPVPEEAWIDIEHRLAERFVTAGVEPAVAIEHLAATSKRGSFWSSLNTAIYSLAAAVMFTGLVSLYNSSGQQQARLETQALQASIQSLMDNSRGLENVLQQVATQNGSLAAADLAAAERLQWRLMMVDQKIHESELSDDITYAQINALWADRIDALTELNKLYYTNQVAVNDGAF